jgi:hypothetical protein
LPDLPAWLLERLEAIVFRSNSADERQRRLDAVLGGSPALRARAAAWLDAVRRIDPSRGRRDQQADGLSHAADSQ